jgi:PmbA protein
MVSSIGPGNAAGASPDRYPFKNPQPLNPEQLLDLARKGGADVAEVYQACSRSQPVTFEASRLKQIESVQSQGLALRIWRNGRPGLAVAHGPVDAQTLVDRAIGLSQLNEPEQLELGPPITPDYADIGTEVPIDQLIAWGKEAIEAIQDQYPDALCAGTWDCEAEMTRLVNSQGLDCSYVDTTLSAYLSAEWVRGDDFLAVMDSEVERGTLDAVSLADRILQRLDWAAQPAPMPSGKYPVIITAKAAELIWGTIQSALNGKQVLEKSSPWSDRLGQVVTHPLITLSQEPAIGPFSSPFDDEGLPTRAQTFIRNGKLEGFYTDLRTGREIMGSTGNGFRPGLGSYPMPSLVNLIVAPGDRTLADLIASLDEGLVIDQVLGGGAGISGEFSINVDLGYRIHKGELVGRVKDTMVAGNVYRALKSLVALGSDAAWHDACFTPSLLLGELSVVGQAD